MKLVTKYQISAINSCWEKCDEKYLGRTEGRTDKGKAVYPPPSGGAGGIKRNLHKTEKIHCHLSYGYFVTINWWTTVELL